MSTAAKTSTRDFESDGFAVLHGFLEIGELPRIKALIDLMLRSPSEQACRRPHNDLFPLRWNDDLVRLLLESSSRTRRLATVSIANDLKWISGYVSIKQAQSPALWWHQDWWCWHHEASYRRTSPQIATLCYVDKTNMHNGALRLLPGSHHRSAPIHALLPDAHSQAAEELDLRHPAMNNLPGQVTLSLEAGDAVMMDYRLLHGTHANSSAIRRDCIILNFAPSWQQLPNNIRAHLIRHPAQPSQNEIVPKSISDLGLLPTFHSEASDLPLNRNAPHQFAVAD